MFLGVDPSEILGSLENSAPQQQQQGPRADDKDLAFAGKVVGSAEDVWSEILSQRGVAFSPANLTAYDNATSTACGIGQSAAGPFYCPNDRHVYLDLAFFGELKSRFGAPGDFAQAYVIAHEYGHHIQNLLGTMERHQDELQGASARGEGGASVRLELQADCYSGVWANHANSRFSILETGDVEEGLRAASAVGDDTLEKQTQGYVVPDSFTHGSSEQRVRWFRRGLQSGDMDSCNTFAARDL
jgi:predicted metalloprotease